jgi:hypothetical protein
MSQPSWLNDSDPVPAQAPASVPASQSGGSSSTTGIASDGTESGGGDYKIPAQIVMALISCSLCTFMAFVGAMGIKGAASNYEMAKASGSSSASTKVMEIATTDMYIGTYMVIFALILFVYEIGYLTKLEFVNDIVKRNFGFLFGPIGKCCYCLFISLMVFGMTQPANLVLACGISVACWGPFQVVYYMRFPDHWDKIEKYDPKKDGIRL